jgi:hypothetical protein
LIVKSISKKLIKKKNVESLGGPYPDPDFSESMSGIQACLGNPDISWIINYYGLYFSKIRVKEFGWF